jgi:hypothetical protein
MLVTPGFMWHAATTDVAPVGLRSKDGKTAYLTWATRKVQGYTVVSKRVCRLGMSRDESILYVANEFGDHISRVGKAGLLTPHVAATDHGRVRSWPRPHQSQTERLASTLNSFGVTDFRLTGRFGRFEFCAAATFECKTRYRRLWTLAPGSARCREDYSPTMMTSSATSSERPAVKAKPA